MLEEKNLISLVTRRGVNFFLIARNNYSRVRYRFIILNIFDVILASNVECSTIHPVDYFFFYYKSYFRSLSNTSHHFHVYYHSF